MKPSLVAESVKNLPAKKKKKYACSAGDAGSIPGSGTSPGERNGNPLQYPCLENLMDRGASWAAIHGFSRPRILEWVGFPFSMGSSQPRGQTQVSHTVNRRFIS